MRQKLKYRVQIETKGMTHDIILTPSIITATLLCHCHVTRWQLDTWQNVYFLKKIQKKIEKKIQKIEELTRGTPFNGVNPNLTKRANLRRFNKKGINLRLLKIRIPSWDFDSKMGTKCTVKPKSYNTSLDQNDAKNK